MSEGLLSALQEAFTSLEPHKVEQRQRVRLAAMVSHARAMSPYYRHLYRNLPDQVDDARLLPVTTKKKLMARFDDWVTDRAVTMKKLRAFVETPERAGEAFLGRYTVTTSAGTGTTPGIFAVDEHAMQVANALTLRMLSDWLDIGDIVKILFGGARMALTITSGHSATAVAAAVLHRSAFGRKRMLALPAHAPLSAVVAELNGFRPTILASYGGIAGQLASEQEAGRLNIRPVLVVPSTEGLSEADDKRIAAAFRAKVCYSYAVTECAFLGYSCAQGWLHVNSDWAVLEPVDANYRPTPPGEPSHTVLISNLANRVQPVLRCDLGESVLQRPDPCPCGNPLPAIRVQEQRPAR